MVAYLRERAIDGRIVDVRVGRNPSGRYLGDVAFTAPVLVTQILHTVARRGKYMIFHLSDGLLVAHNAMSGYWDIKGDEWCFDYVEGARKANDKDVRVEIDVVCDKELKTIRFHDSRLFGSLKYYPVRSIEDIPVLHALGPEALETVNVDLTIDPKKKRWSLSSPPSSKHEIKHVLMNQQVIAGFGNIYTAELLHRAGVDPFRPADTVTPEEWKKIWFVGLRVLQEALDRKLDYSSLTAYRRTTCKFCKGPILKKDLRGRSTYFCPSCQR